MFRVADQLPRANLLLLKPLLAVLHRISQNAGTSRMGASNLAICVGPNMLSPGTDSTLPLEVQKEINDKVTVLVEFLIENCTAIFGDDVAYPCSPLAEEAPEHTGSPTAHPGTAQQDAAAHHSPEPEAACGPATAELQQPRGRSPSRRRTCATCISALPLPPLKNLLGTMPRRRSEPTLSFPDSSEGSGRHRERTSSVDNVAVQEQQPSLGKEALGNPPAPWPAPLAAGSTPPTSSSCSPESCCPACQGPCRKLLGGAANPASCWRAMRTMRKRRRRRRRRRSRRRRRRRRRQKRERESEIESEGEGERQRRNGK
ncbi:T-cell activation Rho GTPase-activating protein-like [Struthio camelus]|uniref:T-cell activation Rho GTPase-activating protein-like n=1 Tax=Struthio camelus TaxID=8801 RepID=UPI00360423CA